VIGLTALLLLAGCNPDVLAENSPAIPTPYTPQPPATLASGDLPADLPPTITFTPAAVEAAQTCADTIPAENDLPAVTGFRTAPNSMDGLLCLYGLPVGRPFSVGLIGPDGTALAQDSFTIRGLGSGYYDVIGDTTREPQSLLPDGDARQIEGVATISLRLWLPVGGPVGTWQVEATSGNQTVSGTVEIEPLAGMAISTLPTEGVNPLLDERCATYHPGESVRVAGTGFDTLVTVGLYYMTAFEGERDQRTAQLVRYEAVTPGADGTFGAGWTLDTRLPFGLYYTAGTSAGGDWQAAGTPPCFEIAAAPTPEPGG
jgi:hypothetical protein